MEQPKCLRVVWVDAMIDVSEEGERKDIPIQVPSQTTITVGWLVKESRNMLVLSTDWVEEGGLFSGILRIPKKWIKTVVSLGPLDSLMGKGASRRGKGQVDQSLK